MADGRDNHELRECNEDAVTFVARNPDDCALACADCFCRTRLLQLRGREVPAERQAEPAA
jgi:hypothetical protein